MRGAWTRAALAAVATAALGACQMCEDPVPSKALSNEPAGARCRTSGECAAGLPCTEGLCALGCAGIPSACPAGTACVLTGLCLPGCAADADCQLGSTAGACTGALPPSPAYCFPVSCNADEECPPGSRCVEASRATGITWNDTCTTGWCQR
jgi:hypothetical protein